MHPRFIMSLFADRKYWKKGMGEEDTALRYLAERKKKPRMQRQRERMKSMDDFKEKNNGRTTGSLSCYCKQTTLKHSGWKSSCSAIVHAIYTHSLHFHWDQTPFFLSKTLFSKLKCNSYVVHNFPKKRGDTKGKVA